MKKWVADSLAKQLAARSKARKGKKVRRVPRAVKPARHEFATCRVNQSFALMNPNTVYTNYNAQLSSFPRAINIAQGYQFYRIKRITYKFSPLSDTFAAGAGATVPYLYFMIDRLQTYQNATSAAQLRAVGAKPRRVDDKIITWSYTPSVKVGTYDSLPPAGQSSTQFTQYKMSPWLSCRDNEGPGAVWNPDSTDHLGCVWLLENSGGSPVQYKCERIIEFEFKKPAYQIIAGPNDPPPVDVETLVEPQ